MRYAIAAVATVALLAGCASTYTLDNTVQSFSHISALPQPATYRFERLLSQQDITQPQLEAFADPALNAAGLRRDDSRPRYSVQVSARAAQTLSPWADPWAGPGFGFGVGVGGWRRGGWGWGLHSRYGYEAPWYHREVDVVVRDLSNNNQVVYESRAISDGPFMDSKQVIPAMFVAAMQGFPNPPAGPRRVDVQVPS
jgi:hypothetical protein